MADSFLQVVQGAAARAGTGGEGSEVDGLLRYESLQFIGHACAQQYVGKYQSCMDTSGRFTRHAPVE